MSKFFFTQCPFLIFFTFFFACSNSEFPSTTESSDAFISLGIDSLPTQPDSTCITPDSSYFIKSDSINKKNNSSTTQKDSTAVKNDSSSVKKDSTAISSDSSKVSKDSTENKNTPSNESAPLLPQAGFKQAFTLTPPSTQNIVRCTFDGTEPDTNSQIFINEKIIDTTTVVRCTEFKNGKVSRQQTETYFINESIKMPVVSISISPDYVKNYLDAPPCKDESCKPIIFFEDVEVPAHIEYFANGSDTKEKDFEIRAGVSIMGGGSRNQQKKSVSVVIRKEYQQEKLYYPLFDIRPESNKFKAFILRNNGNRFKSDYVEDAMATSLLEGTNVDHQRSKQVIVFYNGQYHGIYDMKEKLNEHFVETNYGINDDNVDFIKHSNNTLKVQNGSSDEYVKMLQFIYNSNFAENNEAYDSVKKMLDILNFIEYMAAEIYFHNGDWPQNNVRAWKSPNTPWRFIAFDIDHGFDWTNNITGFSQEKNIIDWIYSGGRADRICGSGNHYLCFHNIFVKLMENSTFRQTFINRATYLYSEFINAEKVSSKIDEINATIDKNQIQRDLKLYKRSYYKNSCGKGFDANGSCIKSWSKQRDKSVMEDLKNAYKLKQNVTIAVEIKGKGNLKLDNFYIPQNNIQQWTVFEGHPMHFSVECFAGSKFKSWEDGSTYADRTIYPLDKTRYSAECI